MYITIKQSLISCCIIFTILFFFRIYKKTDEIKVSTIIALILTLLIYIINTFITQPLISIIGYLEINMAGEFYSGTIFHDSIVLSFFTFLPYIIGLLILFFKDRKYFFYELGAIVLLNYLQCLIFTIDLIS